LNPPFGRGESDLLFLTFAIQLRCLAHPFIVTVRANPVAAPAAPIIDLPLDQSYVVIVSKPDIIQIKNCSMNLSLTGGAGAPTGFARTVPMKGRAVGSSVLATKSTTLAEQGFALRLDPTSESEGQQIRFASPEGRIQARVEDPKRRANL